MRQRGSMLIPRVGVRQGGCQAKSDEETEIITKQRPRETDKQRDRWKTQRRKGIEDRMNVRNQDQEMGRLEGREVQ